MELSDAQIDKIAGKAAEKVWAFLMDDPKTPGKDAVPASVFQAWSPSYGRVDGVGAKVDAVEAKVDQLIEMLRPPA